MSIRTLMRLPGLSLSQINQHQYLNRQLQRIYNTKAKSLTRIVLN